MRDTYIDHIKQEDVISVDPLQTVLHLSEPVWYWLEKYDSLFSRPHGDNEGAAYIFKTEEDATTFLEMFRNDSPHKNILTHIEVTAAPLGELIKTYEISKFVTLLRRD